MDAAWEDQISINSFDQTGFEIVAPAASHLGMALNVPNHDDFFTVDEVPELARADVRPIPALKDREGYYGPNHLSYWLSGLRDRLYLQSLAEKYGVTLKNVLDIGCASGRVIRHFAYDDFLPGLNAVYGCDINARHVRWVQEHLSPALTPFQSTSVPYLPLESGELDLVTTFSVFSHIEAFESGWLMEIRRVLRRGGLFYCTIQSDHTWKTMTADWPAYQAASKHPDFEAERAAGDMTKDRLIFRWRGDRSYSSNVYLHRDYIRRVWSRYFDIVAIAPAYPGFQDSVILRRR